MNHKKLVKLIKGNRVYNTGPRNLWIMLNLPDGDLNLTGSSDPPAR